MEIDSDSNYLMVHDEIGIFDSSIFVMIPYISYITSRFHFSAILVKQTQFLSSEYTYMYIQNKCYGADHFTSEDIDNNLS